MASSLGRSHGRFALSIISAIALATAIGGSALAGTNWATWSPPSNAFPTNMQAKCYDNVRMNTSPANHTLVLACLSAAARDYNHARSLEHLGAFRLPSNYLSLNTGQQLLVLINMERVDRGLRPIAGISRALSTYATAGATALKDPAFPSWSTPTQRGSILATGHDPLYDEYLFMYYDGYAAGMTWNADCFAPSAPKCWIHRHAQLRENTTPLLTGIGWTTAGSGSMAALLLGQDSHDKADYWMWSKEVPYFQRGSKENP